MSLPAPMMPISLVSPPSHLTAKGIETTDHMGRDVEQVAREFESVFVSLLIKNLRGTLSDDGLFGSEASDTYGGLFDLYMGQHLAASQPLGIGQIMKAYLAGELTDDRTATPQSEPESTSE